MKTLWLTCGAVLATGAGCLAHGDWSCDAKEQLEGSVQNLTEVSSVRIIARSGALDVAGAAGLDAVRAVGEACAESEEKLGEVELRVQRQGGEVVVETVLPDQSSMDLTVELPDDVPVIIEDGSGALEVRGVGDLRIDDGSGSMTIEQVGALEIEDGSGSIKIRNVDGDLEIRDGSGSISVEDVHGDVRLDDGAGSVRLVRIDGSVYVEDDGSGSIEVREVGGDFTVEDDGSGGIRHSQVAGRVRIPD